MAAKKRSDPNADAVDVCAQCGNVMRAVDCGICGQNVFSAPLFPKAGSWNDGPFTFVVRAASDLEKAHDRHVEDGLADKLADLVPPFVDAFAGATHSRASSWVLARVAALSDGAPALQRSQSHHEKIARQGYYTLDLQVGRGNELVGTITVIGGAEVLVCTADTRSGSAKELVTHFVASLRREPSTLAEISVRVRNEDWVPDCDVYTNVETRNIFGYDGQRLLGEKNPIFETDRRPPPETPTPEIARSIFSRRGPGHFELPWSWLRRRNVAPLVEAFLASPDQHDEPIAKLTIGSPDPVHGFTPVVSIIQRHLPGIEELTLGRELRIWGEKNFPAIDLSKTDLPNLEKLSLLQVGHVTLVGAKLPRLRKLLIEQELGEPDISFVRDLGTTHFPSLETLTIELQRGQESVQVDAEAMRGLLSGNFLPALRECNLFTFRFADSFFEALIDCPLFGRIDSLRLGWTRMTDRGAKVLLAHPDRLRRLKEFSIHASELSDVTLARLRAVGPGIHMSLPWGVAPTTSDTGETSSRRVRHPRFGEGTVFEILGAGETEKLVIDFDDVGRKTLLASFVDYVD